MKYGRGIFLFSCILAMCCFAEEGQKSKPYSLSEGLVIMVPQNVSAHRQPRTIDFDVITFKKGTNFLLAVYVGNAPDFPKEKHAGKAEKGTINGLKTESVIVRQKDGTGSRDVLFHLLETNGWPQCLHCWYSGLGHSDSAEADKMISTVHWVNRTNNEPSLQPAKK